MKKSKQASKTEKSAKVEPAKPSSKSTIRRYAKSAGAPTRPTERRRSPEEVQARILQAATAEFAEHSFSGARIERISKRAKTVDRMLYYYFGSKERLYQAVGASGVAVVFMVRDCRGAVWRGL